MIKISSFYETPSYPNSLDPKFINLCVKLETNLKAFELLNDIKNIVIKKRIIKSLTEYGSPQWISGISFFAGNVKKFFCLAKKENSWILQKYENCLLYTSDAADE